MHKEDQKNIGDRLKYLSWFCVFLLLPFPVDIYYVTRIILCFGAIYGAFKLYYLNPNSDKIFLLGITAVIFNPLFPFYFQIRSIWMLMDIFAAYAFYVSSKEFIKLSHIPTTRSNKKTPGYSPLKQSTSSSKGFQQQHSSEQGSQNLSQKKVSKNNISEFEKDLSALSDQEVQDLIDIMDADDDKDQVLNKKIYDPGLNFKTIKAKGMQGSLNFSEPNKPASKLDDAVEYFFAYSLFLLKTEVNGLKLSESKKFDFRSKYIAYNKIKNHGVWFFSRIELESSKFTNYHVSSKTTDKIFKGDDMINSEIRSYLKTII